MKFNVSEKEVRAFVKERFVKKYKSNLFNTLWNIYKNLDDFKINENIFEKIPALMQLENKEELHFIIRTVTQFYATKMFQGMKVDLEDPNVMEELENGNIGTPGRISKMWCGAGTHDDRELMGGRFHEPVRMASFPNNISDNEIINPIVKEVDLMAVCSHHLAPFGTLVGPDAKVVISYIPDQYVLGISKLQRVVRYVAQRGWLQEDLTKAIYNEIVKVAETESVYVGLRNIEHTCEKYRGAMTQSQGFTTEYFGGKFKEDSSIIENVRNHFSR